MEEQSHMIREDKLGGLLREIDKEERERRAIEREFGSMFGGTEGSFLLAEDGGEEERGQGGKKKNKLIVRLPKWCPVPAGWETWLLTQQMEFVKRAIAVRTAVRRINKQLLIERKRLERLQASSLLLWEQMYLEASKESITSELGCIELDEFLKVNIAQSSCLGY